MPSEPGRGRGTAPEVFDRFRDHDWIVNSRNTADEEVVRVLGSLAGFEPRVAHRADSLELVQDMIVAGLGVGLLPSGQPAMRGMTLQTLHHPPGDAAGVRRDPPRAGRLAAAGPGARPYSARVSACAWTVTRR